MLALDFTERKVGIVEPVCTVEHKGFEVQLYVWQAIPEITYTAMYEIPDGQLSHRAVVAGKFKTAKRAEDAALESAKRWIDENAGKT